MKRRGLFAGVCLLIVVTAAWVGGMSSASRKPDGTWSEVVPGVWRSPGLPAGHALVDGDAALLIDAPGDAQGLKGAGVKKVEGVLLTHHHRDTCAGARRLLEQRVPVRAARSSAEWLVPESVRKHWQDSLPLRNSRTAYLVVAEGLEGVDCSLQDEQLIEWHGWKVQVVASPGHARDHLAFVARKGGTGPLVLFAGDALARPGKMWSPYTTDWDHWTDLGLKPAAQSLRKLAGLKPDLLLPAHGEPIRRDAAAALERTVAAVEEIAFLKSFERFSKQRLGNAPEYRFLAKDQVASGGDKPWTRVSDHLFLTGNTYVLTSKEKAFLVLDPWGQRSADQIARLRKEQDLGRLEVVMFSHAHYDHYDGIHNLPERDKLQVWTLDQVGLPIAEPFRLRAPFLDARPVKIDRLFKDGAVATWREYTFRFWHFPGQTEFTMAVETTIDGKRCLFTADNFFHQDQFSGSGGWMGLNRSFPLPYAASAQKVLDVAPEWVLAEHGGPFEFSKEDFRRRVEWGKESARAADALSPSGLHTRDWNPHRIRVEPLLQKAKPGADLEWSLVIDNPLPRKELVQVSLEGRGVVADQAWQLEVPGGKSIRQAFSLRLPRHLTAGRHIFVLQAAEGQALDGADSFLGVDVEP